MGGATTSPKSETTSGSPRQRDTSSRSIAAVTNGIPSSSARARSLSCPSATSTGSSPAAAAVRTARRSTVSPSISRKSLFLPIRLEVPAASRTQPTSAQFMDTPALHPKVQRLATRADRQHLGQDADRHLLRALGAQVEPNRRVDPLMLRHAQLLEELLLARAGPEQAQVCERLPDERAHPVAVVLQRVRLDHREVLPRKLRHTLVRAPMHEPRRSPKALFGEKAAAVIDHGHLKAHLVRQRCERPRVVSRAEDQQRRRRLEHVHEEGVRPALLHAALAPRWSRGDLHAAEARTLDRGLDDEWLRQAERRSARQKIARRGERLRLGPLHENVHGSLAAKAESPDRLLVGARLIMEQPRVAAVEQLQRVLAHVGFEAPTADAAGSAAVALDQELGAGPAIRRAGDPHHGRECGPFTFGELRQTVEDGCGLVPVFHNSSAVRAGHARADPGFQRFHELLVRERWKRAACARVPSPEDEWIVLHVLDHGLARATASVSHRVLDLLADLPLGQAFPLHRHGREGPGRNAWHEAVGRVRRLMARLAGLGGGTVVVLSANDQRLMNDGSVGLPWGVDVMAIHASRMHDDARDRVEQSRIGRWGRFDATAGGDRQDDDEWQEDTHGFSPQAERSWSFRGSFRIRFPVTAKTALVSAAAVTAVGGSPIPPGASRFRTRCTSMGGASLIRTTRTS